MAKRRKKQPLNSLHSKFHETISHSRRFRAEEGEGANEAPGQGGPEEHGHEESFSRRGRSGPRYTERELYNINLAESHAQAMRSPERTAKDLAYFKTRSQRHVSPTTPGPRVAEMDEEFARPRVSKQDVELTRRIERESTWARQPNVYRVSPGERRSSGGFIREQAASSHKQWIESQLRNPESEFNKGLDPTKAKTGKYTPAQRRRLGIYTDALQRGASHQEALEEVRRTRVKERVGRPAEPGRALRETRTTEARQALTPPRPSGRETRYTALRPAPREFTFGVDAQRRQSLDDLKEKFPRRSEADLIQINQAGTELISQELLAHQKWAHETRRANLLGAQKGKIKEAPDKVTIFTTNLGHPAVSIPADSLAGQYIIRKRKSILGGYGVPGSQLRGKFPDAVRDAHIVDVATGAAIGIQGRQGIMNTTGYRFGRKTSQGYGRPKPLGASILYDTASGRPLYDQYGNIRYSEGATRPIDWRTPDVGGRILIG